MYDIFVQAIGFAAVILFIISFQIKSNRALFITQLMGSAFFMTQFLLMGAYSGMISLIAIVIRNALLIKVRDWPWVKSKKTMIVFILICIGCSMFTWNGPMSLLPLWAMIGTTVTYWTDNAQKIRLGILLFDVPGWMIYDAIIGSWGGVLNEIITLASVLVSIWRYGWKSMDDPNSGF